MIKKSSVKGELIIPDDFLKFTGADQKADNSGICKPFAIRFGSPTDQASADFNDKYNLYKKENARAEKEERICEIPIVPIM